MRLATRWCPEQSMSIALLSFIGVFRVDIGRSLMTGVPTELTTNPATANGRKGYERRDYIHS